MIKKAKKQLSLLFILTTGLIFTLALLGANYFFQEQEGRNQWNNFQAFFYSLAGMVQRENSVNDIELSKLESENNSIIYIEDNGNPIDYEGTWNSTVKRNKLVNQLKDLGIKDGINFHMMPISVKELNSSIYQMYDDQGKNILDKFL